MIETSLDALSLMIDQNMWFAPLLAFIAGCLTSLLPCSISSLPLIIGYVGGTGQRDVRRSFLLSVVFALGSALTFTTLGIVATAAGILVSSSFSWWYLVLGFLMILMALQTWEVIHLIPSSYLISRSKKKGYVGALLTGVLAGLFSSPCSTPVLVALLAIVAQQGDLARGIPLMLAYAIGHGLLAVISGTSLGFVQKIVKDERYGVLSTVVKITVGFLILLVGLYMLYLGF